MSTLVTIYCGRVSCHTSGGPVDGTVPPSEGNNNPVTGYSRGRVHMASKASFITDICVHNRHTADAELMIAQTPGGVFYSPAVSTHIRRTPDAGWTIPAGASFDVLVGRRWSLPEGYGLIVLSNIDFAGVTALNIDIIGETN